MMYRNSLDSNAPIIAANSSCSGQYGELLHLMKKRRIMMVCYIIDVI